MPLASYELGDGLLTVLSIFFLIIWVSLAALLYSPIGMFNMLDPILLAYFLSFISRVIIATLFPILDD